MSARAAFTRQHHHPGQPVLRFTPYAWAKLQWFCHAGDTEIGGFGLSSEQDPLLVIDLLTLRQQTTCVSVAFDDEAVADLLDQQVDQGVTPQRCMRIWLHTHPGSCAQPSSVDEETFARVFGRCDWAVMAIVAEDGQTYARLRFNAGPGGQVPMAMQVDYTQPFAGSDHSAWQKQYDQHIHPVPDQLFAVGPEQLERFGGLGPLGPWNPPDPWDLLDELQTAHTFEPLTVNEPEEPGQESPTSSGR